MSHSWILFLKIKIWNFYTCCPWSLLIGQTLTGPVSCPSIAQPLSTSFVSNLCLPRVEKSIICSLIHSFLSAYQAAGSLLGS